MTSSDLLPPPPPTSPGAASGTTQHKLCSHPDLRITAGLLQRARNGRPKAVQTRTHDLNEKVKRVYCTCVLCSGLDRHRAGFSDTNAVSGQHPELVLHPGIQVHHGGCQRVPVDYLWYYKHTEHIVYTKYNNSTTNMKMTCSKDWHSK